MSDKTIINDDDVSKCKYYYKESCVAESFCDCSKISNCYRKQLKRKEQECKKYKECLNDTKSTLEVLSETSILPLKTNILKVINKINEVENEQ